MLPHRFLRSPLLLRRRRRQRLDEIRPGPRPEQREDVVLDDRVRLLSRAEGEATVHPSTVLHAVSGVTSGVRYSLLLFFWKVDEEGDPLYM